VRGALSDPDALRIADTIAHSPLVRRPFRRGCQLGQVLAAAGRRGPAQPGHVDVFIGSAQMVSRGMGCGKAVERRPAGC